MEASHMTEMALSKYEHINIINYIETICRLFKKEM